MAPLLRCLMGIHVLCTEGKRSGVSKNHVGIVVVSQDLFPQQKAQQQRTTQSFSPNVSKKGQQAALLFPAAAN
jgi:hypothetical protein